MNNPLFLKLWKWYKGHKDDVSAHHDKYTDADVIDALADADKVGVGTDTPSEKLEVYGGENTYLKVVADNRPHKSIKIGVMGEWGLGGIWLNQDTPTATNYSFLDGGTAWSTVFNAVTGGIQFRLSNQAKLTVASSGNVGVATTTPTAKLDVNSDIFRLRTPKTPASASAAGNQGDVCWDSSYVYVCVATDTWKRSAISTW